MIAPAQRAFPGWTWVTVAVAFPVAGYIGWKMGGPVDAVEAALIGGGLTGAGTVFGAAGAVLFMLFSGLVVARFTPTSARPA
jgi:hypothetical protein